MRWLSVITVVGMFSMNQATAITPPAGLTEEEEEEEEERKIFWPS